MTTRKAPRTVWFTNLFTGTSNSRPLDFEEKDAGGDVFEKFLSGISPFSKAGDPISTDCLPKRIYVGKDARKTDKFNEVTLYGYLIVNEAVADVFRQFDLGPHGGIYPVEIYQKDRRTRVPGEYFHLVFANRKSAIDPVKSKLRESPVKPSRWIYKPLTNPQDHDYVVDASALEGPDIWHDTAMWKAVFMSDELGKALRTAKLSRRFGLRKCQVIDQ